MYICINCINIVQNQVYENKYFNAKHGEFEQKAYSHLSGAGCPKCADNQKITTEEFIKRAKKIHDDKYDYSKVNYKWNRGKIEIICHKKRQRGNRAWKFFYNTTLTLTRFWLPKMQTKL